MSKTDEESVNERAPLLAHLLELRTRIMMVLAVWLVATCVCYHFADVIYAFLVHPLADAVGGEQRRMIYTGLAEAFFTYLRLAVFGGIVVSFPVIAWQFYGFMAPGLYKRERIVLMPYLIASPLLFLAGAAMVYFYVFPVAWRFFLSFETSNLTGGMPIQLEAKVGEYLGLVIHLLLAFGFAFQLPVVLALLVQLGMVRTAALKRGRKYALVGIVAVAAVITPPDVFSQIALSIPLYLLYELALIACALLEKKRLEETEEEECTI